MTQALYPYIERMDAAVAAAARGCGQSDVLFESRLRPAFEAILADTPSELKTQVVAELRVRGYDPDFDAYEPGERECGLTGIAIDCCPCGRHE